MKLLVVIPSLRRGGAERVISLLSREWAKEHQVTIVVFDASQLDFQWGGKIVDLALSGQTGFWGKWRQAMRRVLHLARCFRSNNPNRIITFMESANFPSILAALMTGKLSCLWVSVRNDPARFPGAYRFLLPSLYRLPARVVAVSKGVAHALALMGIPEQKLIAIPNPAPVSAPLLSTLLMKPTGVPERYILGVGRLHWQKGFDRLIEAISLLKDPDLHLVILGEGNERRALEEQAKSSGVADRVHLPGAIEDIWPWYRHALCFVLSSRHEGWPNVVMEALSQGCPVVAFDCEYGPSEIIKDHVNGFLVQADNVQALVDTIVEAIKSNPSNADIVQHQVLSLKNYSVEECSKMWLVDSN